MYIDIGPVMYCHVIAWHMHVLATNRVLWDGMGHNVSRVTIVLANLKLRLSKACIQGELALAVISVAVEYLYHQSNLRLHEPVPGDEIARPHHSVVTGISHCSFSDS